jgi:hypothetical protein
MWRLAIAILKGQRSALALGLPWHVNIIAMVVGKVEHGSGMTSVKNSLEDTTYRNEKTDAEQGATH